MISWFFWVLIGFFGALWGSFFALCAHRIPLELSVVRPASRCEGCKTPIPWYHNIPVVSYLILRGRCARCGDAIGIQNWLVEVGSGAMALLLWNQFGLEAERIIWLSGPEIARGISPFFASFAFFGALLVGALVDLQTKFLPNVVTLYAIPFSIILSQAIPGQTWLSAVSGAALGFLGLGAIRLAYARLTGREGIGLGDVYLLGMIGGFLGPRLLPVLLFLASVQGVIIGVVMALLARRAKKRRLQMVFGRRRAANRRHLSRKVILRRKPSSLRLYQIPFGPFLALAAMESLFFGDKIIAWYLGRLGL